MGRNFEKIIMDYVNIQYRVLHKIMRYEKRIKTIREDSLLGGERKERLEGLRSLIWGIDVPII